MSQLESFKAWVASRGFRVTLGEILRTEFASEYRKEASLMRRDGWTVTVKLNKKSPGENVYTFTPPIVTEAGLQRTLAVI